MNASVKNQINKSNVMTSTFIIPLAVPIFIIYLFITEGSLAEGIPTALFFGMIFGAVFYIPTILAALMIEAVIINHQSTKNTVLWTLVIEGAGAFLLIGLLLDFFDRDQFALLGLFFSIGIPQLLRWYYLKAKNRMYINEIVADTNSDIIDDIDIEENVEI